MELLGGSRTVERVAVLDAMKEKALALALELVFAFMLRRMHCWRLDENVSVRVQSSIAIHVLA